MGGQYVKLTHQAAGHAGTLTDQDGLLVFKPTIKQEIDFLRETQKRYYKYKNIGTETEDNCDDDDDDTAVHLGAWMPTYLGLLEETNENGEIENDLVKGSLRRGPDDKLVREDLIDYEVGNNTSSESIAGRSGLERNDNKRFIVLENLLNGIVKPNVMDIKLGKLLYDESASSEKKLRLQEVSKCTTSGTLGFRICGMKLEKNGHLDLIDKEHYETETLLENGQDKEYILINKQYGRTRTETNIKEAFEFFFSNSSLNEKRRKQLITMFWQRLQLFYNTLLDEEIRLISSSLLFIYDGDTDHWDALNDEDQLLRDDFIDPDDADEGDDEEETKHSPILSSMSLIDFAHSKYVPDEGYDENIIEGVESLLAIFEEMATK